MSVDSLMDVFKIEFLHWNSEKKKFTQTRLRELLMPDHRISDHQGHWNVRENINKNMLHGKRKQDVIGYKGRTAFLDLDTGLFMPPDQIICLKGRADLCRCFCCGLGLMDWSKDDDPLFVHLKYSPNCGHLIKTIDANLLSVYRRNIQLTREGNSYVVINPGTPNTVKHPKFQEFPERLASFSSWPRDRIQRPNMLAEAGFFHTGVRDIVRCYACDGGLQRFDAEDQPWIEHARWFPYCEHVRRVKGEDYIRIVQAAEANTEQEIPTDNHFALYSKPAQTVVDMGYSKAAVSMAFDECKAKDLRLTADNISNILLEKEDKGEVLPTDSPRSESPAPPQLNAVKKQDLLEEQEYLRRRLLCMVCKQREFNILFLPCGHHKMCTQCSDTVKECPVCLKVILQKVKTFRN